MAAGRIGLASFQRSWMQVSLGEQVKVEPIDPTGLPTPTSLDIQVDFVKRAIETTQTFDTAKLAELFKTNFAGQIFTKEQPFVMDYAGFNLMLRVHRMVDTADIESAAVLLGNQVNVQFFPADGSSIKLIGASAAASSSFNPTSIIAPDLDFQAMGIGGLGDEFAAIFRRAFTSRNTAPTVIKGIGMQHVKGILLYGPPGTGKTLMARQIAQMLRSREPKIINGPEILNKYVGQSEENIRALFRDAEAEYKAKGDASQLHVIIFDEIDAICKQRGNRGDSTGVGDSVVNQLLSKMDGVEQLNNILVIGMTNRLDMIDEALLRPGRFEVKIEIDLPTQEGRLEILKIHTATMRANGYLGEDVDLGEIARCARNYTGAELAGLVRSATSFALARHVRIQSSGVAAMADGGEEAIRIGRNDFLLAFDEVPAAYGLAEDQLSQCIMPYGILHYGPTVDRIIGEVSRAMQMVREMAKEGEAAGKETSMVATLLLHGPRKSGKTAIAAKMALESGFPFVKLIGPSQLAGLSATAKLDAISKAFADAHKSLLALLILDDLEWMLEWVRLGPHYSVPVRQLLKSLLAKSPPPGHRLLVIGTATSARRLRQLGIYLGQSVRVPQITDLEAFEQVVLQGAHGLSPEDRTAIIEHVRERMAEDPGAVRLRISVGTLLGLLNLASQDSENAVHSFTESFKRYLRARK